MGRSRKQLQTHFTFIFIGFCLLGVATFLAPLLGRNDDTDANAFSTDSLHFQRSRHASQIASLINLIIR